VGYPREGTRQTVCCETEWCFAWRAVRPLTDYIEMKRHFSGYVRAGFANPVRGGFDHCVVQPHLKFCHATELNLSQRPWLPPNSPKVYFANRRSEVERPHFIKTRNKRLRPRSTRERQVERTHILYGNQTKEWEERVLQRSESNRHWVLRTELVRGWIRAWLAYIYMWPYGGCEVRCAN
jgi:hypothetical protein